MTTCRYCKGTKKIQLLNSTVDCECVVKGGLTVEAINAALKMLPKEKRTISSLKELESIGGLQAGFILKFATAATTIAVGGAATIAVGGAYIIVSIADNVSLSEVYIQRIATTIGCTVLIDYIWFDIETNRCVVELP